MKINVPDRVEPPVGNWEFWAFRFKPKAQVGDEITFLMDKKPVAKAVVAKIEKPGQSECETTGKFKHLWKVYWKPESFKDLR